MTDESKLDDGLYYMEAVGKEIKFILSGNSAEMFVNGKKDHRVTQKIHVERMITLPAYYNIRKLKQF